MELDDQLGVLELALADAKSALTETARRLSTAKSDMDERAGEIHSEADAVAESASRFEDSTREVADLIAYWKKELDAERTKIEGRVSEQVENVKAKFLSSRGKLTQLQAAIAEQSEEVDRRWISLKQKRVDLSGQVVKLCNETQTDLSGRTRSFETLVAPMEKSAEQSLQTGLELVKHREEELVNNWVALLSQRLEALQSRQNQFEHHTASFQSTLAGRIEASGQQLAQSSEHALLHWAGRAEGTINRLGDLRRAVDATVRLLETTANDLDTGVDLANTGLNEIRDILVECHRTLEHLKDSLDELVPFAHLL